MTIRIHYRRISSYRELPPRCRIIYPEPDSRSPAERYLAGVDNLLYRARADVTQGKGYDIVSLVFGNQASKHEAASRHLAGLVEERRALTAGHLAEIQRRLDELMERRPLRPRWRSYDDGSLTDVEREIHNLEMQKRVLEVALWRDTHELRTAVVGERREQDATRRRIGYLAGGTDAAQ
jgi:hypothetical protein